MQLLESLVFTILPLSQDSISGQPLGRLRHEHPGHAAVSRE
jgi:hypothetical protein